MESYVIVTVNNCEQCKTKSASLQPTQQASSQQTAKRQIVTAVKRLQLVVLFHRLPRDATKAIQLLQRLRRCVARGAALYRKNVRHTDYWLVPILENEVCVTPVVSAGDCILQGGAVEDQCRELAAA